MNHLERTISSLEVAEMVQRRHDQVLRDISTIIGHLETAHTFVVSEYFVESLYEDSTKRKLPCYRLSKKGCELYSTRMTGAKGTQFAVAYIERFNAMEQLLFQPKPLTELEQLKASMRLSLATSEDVETLKGEVSEMKEDMEHLKDNIFINSSQAKAIRRRVGENVYEALGGKETNAFKRLKAKTFAAC